MCGFNFVKEIYKPKTKQKPNKLINNKLISYAFNLSEKNIEFKLKKN